LTISDKLQSGHIWLDNHNVSSSGVQSSGNGHNTGNKRRAKCSFTLVELMNVMIA